MAVSTMHQDTHGDLMLIYRNRDGVYIDGRFDDSDSDIPAWRGIYTPQQARKIANRLNQLADIMEGK